MDKIILVIVIALGVQGCVKEIENISDNFFLTDTERREKNTDQNYVAFLQDSIRTIQLLRRERPTQTGADTVNTLVKKADDDASAYQIDTSGINQYKELKTEASRYLSQNTKYIEPVKKATKVDAVKNNHALHKHCIGGVCLGDRPKDLLKHKWIPVSWKNKNNVMNNRKLSKYQYQGSTKTLNKIAPYILLYKFDGDALKHINGLTAVCNQTDLEGSFKTKNGYTVNVTLSAMPQKNGSYVFEVTYIHEVFWGISKDDLPELNSIEKTLKSQYPAVATAKEWRTKIPGGHWFYLKNDDIGAASVTVQNPNHLHDKKKWINTSLMKNKKCTVSISLD